MTEGPGDRPLRILSIVNVPWDTRLGAARVWIELGAEWSRAGHVVEKYCLTDAFPKLTSSAPLSAIRLLAFPRCAAAYVRGNAGRFDIIDCLIGTLPFRKTSLGFAGLLVARSVGLFHSYDKFERVAAKRWQPSEKGKRVATLFYNFFNAVGRLRSRRSIARCDLLNLPNGDEVQAVRQQLRCGTPSIIQPYGLRPDYAEALARAAASPEQKLQNRQVCFLGMWSTRKGARHWAEIIRVVRTRVPDARFLFLGTMIDDAVVLRDLGSSGSVGIEIVTQYQPEELPALLAGATVGAFPSYIEGFGIAVLEQLAAGIPVVAYDCTGPRDILRAALPQLLTPVGGAGAVGEKLASVLTSDPEQFRDTAARSRQRAAQYRWPDIADRTLEEYRKHLLNLQPYACS
jgi:glycosyltransferase involved in cell wall biosynthesis